MNLFGDYLRKYWPKCVRVPCVNRIVGDPSVCDYDMASVQIILVQLASKFNIAFDMTSNLCVYCVLLGGQSTLGSFCEIDE